jgi:hypothetical protein
MNHAALLLVYYIILQIWAEIVLGFKLYQTLMEQT